MDLGSFDFGLDDGEAEVILIGDGAPARSLTRLIQALLDGVHDKTGVTTISIGRTGDKSEVAAEMRSMCGNVRSISPHDVLVLLVDLPVLGGGGELLDAWNDLLEIVIGKMAGGLRLILVLTTVNSFLYPDQIRDDVTRTFKVGRPSDLYLEMLDPELLGVDGEVVFHDEETGVVRQVEVDGDRGDDRSTGDGGQGETPVGKAGMGICLVVFSVIMVIVGWIARGHADHS